MVWVNMEASYLSRFTMEQALVVLFFSLLRFTGAGTVLCV